MIFPTGIYLVYFLLAYFAMLLVTLLGYYWESQEGYVVSKLSNSSKFNELGESDTYEDNIEHVRNMSDEIVVTINHSENERLTAERVRENFLFNDWFDYTYPNLSLWFNTMFFNSIGTEKGKK